MSDDKPDARQQALALLANVAAAEEKLAEVLAQRLKEVIDERDRLIAERDRYLAENRRLWARITHARETLAGQLTPPQIDEIRKVRGLEPL